MVLLDRGEVRACAGGRGVLIGQAMFVLNQIPE
jgi:hypothetical protein